MTVKPRPGYLSCSLVELTDQSKSGLFIPTKANAFKVLESNVEGIVTGEILMLSAETKLNKLSIPSGEFFVVPAAAVIATINQDA